MSKIARKEAGIPAGRGDPERNGLRKCENNTS